MSNADDIKRNSHKIWLAGMGAYSMIKETGFESFESLVEKGQQFEKDTNPKSDVAAANDSRLDELKTRANQTMDRIERAFDLRVSSALGRLGISRKSDLDSLNEKVDKLTKLLEQVSESVDKK
ncbi:MAG: phasin family protein [Pseudomonadales bacterium]|nr:phasin family protein [Pseudomonadales bacterium]